MHARWRLLLGAMVALAPAPVAAATSRVPAPTSVAPAAVVPPSPVISIRDLGYGVTYSMTGATARADFTFPLPTNGMAEGALTLVTNPSPSLRGSSLVRVFADGALISTANVTTLRQNGSWTFRLPPARHRYLQIRLESALLVETGGACNDENATLWIAIDGRSALRYTPAPGLQSIADFFRLPGGRFILDADWRTPASQSAAIAVFAAVRRAIGSDPAEFVIGSVTHADATSRPERHIVVASGQPLHRDGDTLYVDAGPAALQSLTRETSRTARLAGSLAAAAADLEQQAPRTCGTNRLCLQDLGLGDQSVAGVGSLVTSFGFTLAQFGGWPNNLAFDLDAVFDAVPTTTLERAVLRVRLNGALVHSQDIRGESSVHTSIPLPTPLVDVANRLEVEFFYAPVTGNCQGSPYAMTAQLRRTSALTWGGLGATRGRLGEVITAADGRVALELVNATPVLAQTAARVLGAIGVSTILPIDAARDRRTGPDMLRFVVGRSLAGVPVHLTLAGNVELVAASTGHRLLDASPDRPLVALEYLPDHDMLVLQASAAADDGTVAAAFSDLVSDGQWLGAAGNTLVSNGDETLVLDLTSGSLVVRAAGGPPKYWAWMRWLIFLVAAALVSYLLYVLYVRLGRRPPVPVRPHAR